MIKNNNKMILVGLIILILLLTALFIYERYKQNEGLNATVPMENSGKLYKEKVRKISNNFKKLVKSGKITQDRADKLFKKSLKKISNNL